MGRVNDYGWLGNAGCDSGNRAFILLCAYANRGWMMTLEVRLKTGLLFGLLLLIAATVGADDVQLPRRDFSFPIAIDIDHGAFNGDVTIIRFMPLA